MTGGVTVAELNACSQPRFVETLGWIFEDSPWVAERAWSSRPFAAVDDLHTAMTTVMAQATMDERLALLRAHPDLGTRARMSDASVGEQKGAGLDRLTREEFDRLQRLNRAYREKFGFPFLFAVKGSTKHDILAALERRLAAAPEEELDEALRQVGRIALFRLRDLLG
jgi:OHCU decarboxylase